MRPWPENLLVSLRHLAAARYFLPVALQTPSEWEAQYQEYLHHTEFGLALEILVDIGNKHSEYGEETLFWSECLLAAQKMDMDAEAKACKANLERLSNETR